MNLPTKKYDIIVADPPWSYNFSKSGTRKIENHYETMSLEDIQALDIPSICKKDTILFLWTTAPKLIEGINTLQSWEFTYKTNYVWKKTIYGMGYWARCCHEHILIGTRGKCTPPIPEQRKSSVIEYPSGKHSQKPEVLIDYIDMWYPTAEKIELFARRRRLGWEYWGNEA